MFDTDLGSRVRSCAVVDKQCLEKVQIRAVNMVSNIGKGSYCEKLAKLNMTTLEERWWRGDMIQTWRIMTGKDRVRVDTWFDLEVDRMRDGWIDGWTEGQTDGQTDGWTDRPSDREKNGHRDVRMEGQHGRQTE